MSPETASGETASSEDAVRYEAAAGVATLTMDQPHNRNALTAALLNGLADGLAAAAADPAVRIVVLTHTGPAFCAGADLSGGGSPVRARIAGHCLGGGVGLAAACDLSVAADGARFGFTEVRIGVAPAIISVVCLPKLSRADALELFLSGERISAARAAQVGLITRAVPAGDLDGEVTSLTGKLLAGGPAALAAAKQLIYRVPQLDRAAAFGWTSELSRSLFASPEAAEGMAAFKQKRSPSWAPASNS